MGKGMEERGGDERGEGSLCVFMFICVFTNVKYLYEVRVVCTNGFMLVVLIFICSFPPLPPLPLSFPPPPPFPGNGSHVL